MIKHVFKIDLYISCHNFILFWAEGRRCLVEAQVVVEDEGQEGDTKKQTEAQALVLVQPRSLRHPSLFPQQLSHHQPKASNRRERVWKGEHRWFSMCRICIVRCTISSVEHSRGLSHLHIRFYTSSLENCCILIYQIYIFKICMNSSLSWCKNFVNRLYSFREICNWIFSMY